MARIMCRILLISMILFLVGCLANLKSAGKITTGTIATENTRIEAVDGSFALETGKQFVTPYHNSMLFDSPGWNFVFGDNDVRYVSLVNKSSVALKQGARNVFVSSPYSATKLYGILFFGEALEGATGASNLNYLIQIPKQYVDKAKNGGISVIYEYQDIQNYRFPTWILWISDQNIFKY